MRGMFRILVPALVLATAACAPRQPDTVDPDAAPVRVEVINHFALPMEIYVVAGGTSHRLGLVHPGMQGDFVVPPGLVVSGPVEFLARPSQSIETYRSGPNLLAPGAVVDFSIAAQLFNSTVTLRP